MLRNIIIVGFCLLNVILFIQIGIDVAAVTPEQAMAEGVTQRIYASISYLDYAMATLWGIIALTILLAQKEFFLRAMWLYLGVYLCDIHFGHYMSVEGGMPEWIFGALALVLIQSVFLWWAEKQINKSRVVKIQQDNLANTGS